MQEEIHALELQLHEVNTLLAQQAAARARRTAQWIAEGVHVDIELRVRYDEEHAATNARKCEITLALFRAKGAHRQGLRTDLHSALCKLLNDQGLGHIIDQAHQLVQASRQVREETRDEVAA